MSEAVEGAHSPKAGMDATSIQALAQVYEVPTQEVWRGIRSALDASPFEVGL